MKLRHISALILLSLLGLSAIGCSGSAEEASPTPPAAAAQPAEDNPNKGATQVSPNGPASAL